MTTTPPRPVVVGHDGTYASSGALRFALTEARRNEAPLRVVHAMPLRTSAFLDLPVLAEDLDAERQQVEATLSAEVARLADDVDVQLYALRGQATERLIAAAAGEEMLVVGTRGAGGFTGLRFGSTATQVVRHSPIPG